MSASSPKNGTSPPRPKKLGTDRILWASDYPHPEYHPGILDELLERIAPLSTADQARILGTNAIECYGLETASTQP